MIRRIVQAALNAPFVVFLLVLGLVVAGLLCYSRLDIEAYPDPVPPLVEVITQPEGWSAEEVERQVTVPLEIRLAGQPGLEPARSKFLFRLPDGNVYFGWGSQHLDGRREL